MSFVLTINQRLAGNLFSNRYYLPATDITDAVTAGQAIFQAQRQIQTADVEYTSMAITQASAPFATTPIEIASADVNGQIGGEATMPSITFLEFVFLSTTSRRKTTHRVRGCAANDYTDLGVFNAVSRGLGDVDSGGTVPLALTSYSSYLSVVAANSADSNFSPIESSQRISVGSKRATRAL
jgi:hypothetical protein